MQCGMWIELSGAVQFANKTFVDSTISIVQSASERWKCVNSRPSLGVFSLAKKR